MTDYKHIRYDPEPESPWATIISFVILVAICALLLTAPTWSAWIDSIWACQ